MSRLSILLSSDNAHDLDVVALVITFRSGKRNLLVLGTRLTASAVLFPLALHFVDRLDIVRAAVIPLVSRVHPGFARSWSRSGNSRSPPCEAISSSRRKAAFQSHCCR